jgi:carboxyl-terminal processing protease
MNTISILRLTSLTLVLCASVLLTACGGSSENQTTTLASGYPSAPVSCAGEGQRSWVRDYLNDRYLWSDKQGTPNEAATSMAQYLDALLYKPVDRHSGVQSSVIYNRLIQEGRRIGYGYSLLTNVQSDFVVSYVEPEGPSKAAGLQRGDVIVTIDGLTAADIRSGKQHSGCATKFCGEKSGRRNTQLYR